MSTDFSEFLNELSDDQKAKLKKLLTEDNAEQSSSPTEDVHVNNDFTVSRNNELKNRKVPVRFKKNKWSDDGELRDIETPSFQKTPRNRPKPSKQEVECHVCGRTFSINSNLIYGEFHRCNRCTGR